MKRGIAEPERLSAGQPSAWRIRMRLTRNRYVFIVAGTRKECLRLASLFWGVGQ